MDQELKKLISLQHVDNEIQEIVSLSGDLPNRVNKKEAQLNDIKSKLESTNHKIAELEKDSRKISSEIEDSQAKLEKYKDQLFLVKTNKEYDALNSEIDHLKSVLSNSEDLVLKMQSDLESESEIKKSVNQKLKKLQNP